MYSGTSGKLVWWQRSHAVWFNLVWWARGCLDDLGELVGVVPEGPGAAVLQGEVSLPRLALLLVLFVEPVAKDRAGGADADQKERQKGFSDRGHALLGRQGGVGDHLVDEVEVVEPLPLSVLPVDGVLAVVEAADLSVPEVVVLRDGDGGSDLPEVFFLKVRVGGGVVVLVGVGSHVAQGLHVFGVARFVVLELVLVLPLDNVASVVKVDDFSLDPLAVLVVRDGGAEGELGSAADGFRDFVVVCHVVLDGLLEFLQVVPKVIVFVGASVLPLDGVGVVGVVRDGSVPPLSVFKDRDGGSDGNVSRGRTAVGRTAVETLGGLVVVAEGVLDHLVHDGSGGDFFDLAVFVPLHGVGAASVFDDDAVVPLTVLEHGDRSSGGVGTRLVRGSAGGVVLGVVLGVGDHFVDLVAVVVVVRGAVLPGHRVHLGDGVVGGDGAGPPALVGEFVVDLRAGVPGLLVVEFSSRLGEIPGFRGSKRHGRFGSGLGGRGGYR
ncbi:unnamed protein product [Pseudo-nitzschia multistriata]|uniref:Uncharacterized protein n=1 Tax=Pseudo-nitzschia multistriata TaxID=183589 RepID=A0A448Z0Q6_9STRA|nr:unnamed protein product [Pseudo-nitzschia multistriata]